MDTTELDELLSKYAKLDVDSDGMTRIASYLLTENNIPHVVMMGYAYYLEVKVEPHFWIVLTETGEIVDYRLIEYPTNETRDYYGIFKYHWPPLKYVGEEVKLAATKRHFDILTGDYNE
jgi:hypothetical protein